MDNLTISELTVPKTFGQILTWLNQTFKSIVNFVNNLNKKIDENIVVGVYRGDGTEERTINLGFTPLAVNVYDANGSQAYSYGVNYYWLGGLAVKNHASRAVEICDNGFKVVSYTTDSHRFGTNSNNNLYYFVAYKSGEFMEIN